MLFGLHMPIESGNATIGIADFSVTQKATHHSSTFDYSKKGRKPLVTSSNFRGLFHPLPLVWNVAFNERLTTMNDS